MKDNYEQEDQGDAFIALVVGLVLGCLTGSGATLLVVWLI